LALGCTVAELETTMSAAEYREWIAFYSIDPWGDQRADMRMARLAKTLLLPHTKSEIDPNDFLLFPDDAHELPDDVEGKERDWMLKLQRST
jgi:hypothetical protein